MDETTPAPEMEFVNGHYRKKNHVRHSDESLIAAIRMMAQGLPPEEVSKQTKVGVSSLGMIQRVAVLMITNAEARQAAEGLSALRGEEREAENFMARLKEIGKKDAYAGWK